MKAEGFVEKKVICPKCGKVLLKGYSNAVLSVTCKCKTLVILHARKVVGR